MGQPKYNAGRHCVGVVELAAALVTPKSWLTVIAVVETALCLAWGDGCEGTSVGGHFRVFPGLQKMSWSAATKSVTRLSAMR
ncbi:MAG: hypothetical protein AAB092_02530 [Chloroflexota bacterium]